MHSEEFRVIPEYREYEVSRDGTIRCLVTGDVVTQFKLNGYLVVDAFYSSRTETLPVHRAVALAWVPGRDRSRQVVNHKDGDTMNNDYLNLEWVTYSENNFHAVNTGLRGDNFECLVRNYETKEITRFASMSQAARFLKVTMINLFPKQFGKLHLGKYEVKYAVDKSPWFYENRTELVPPSRYMVTVTYPDGSVKEIFSNVAMMKAFQLYNLPKQSMAALVMTAKERFPDLKFDLRDGYMEEGLRLFREKETNPVPVEAFNGEIRKFFQSLTACATFFKVDRSSIQNRLNNGKDLDGWTFSSQPR